MCWKDGGARWVNVDKAQPPLSNGNLFGIALTLDPKGLYYVDDDTNGLALAR